MKKIMNKVKKIFFVIGTFFITIYSKSIAAISPDPIYGVQPAEPLVIDKIVMRVILEVARNIIIPVVFIIGTVVYFKKSASSTLRKIITIIISLAVVILICLGINYMINLGTNLI